MHVLPANILLLMFQTDQQKSRLKCRFLDNGNPFVKICRFKLEEVSSKPHIVVIQDFLPLPWADGLQKLAKSVGMTRSRHIDPRTSNLVASSMRTSKQYVRIMAYDCGNQERSMIYFFQGLGCQITSTGQ